MGQGVSSGIQPAELGFFSALAAGGSLSAAARSLGISTAAVSKRLAQMEGRLGVALVNRTTRRMSLTAEGELYLEHARRILGEIDDLERLLGRARDTPSGLLRIHATPGFGRRHVAPAVSGFVRRYPLVEVELTLDADPPPPASDVFDVCIRFGAPPDARVVARLIARNRRVLCASPAYLARHGEPKKPADLARHRCIAIRQGSDGHRSWRLLGGPGGERQSQTVRTRGNLSANDGEIAVAWALDGHGILMRAEWDIARHLESGALVPVLRQYHTPEADIYAIYAQRHRRSLRVTAFVDFLAQSCSEGHAGRPRAGGAR
jgi:LysR family transcriptional activator of dmlA